MNKKTLKLTMGAMATAIFGVLLLLNRQTGNLLQDVFMFLYPVPLVAYAAMYGWKSGIPVLAAMSLLSFLFGGFTTIFYAVTQALTGLVFGGCLHAKVDRTKTLFVVMILSAAVSVLNTLVLGFVTGIDMNQEAVEMQTMMQTIADQSGMVMPENMLSVGFLKQMIIISMALLGIFQGFIVYEVSLLLLRRLRFPVQKPKSVFLYVPPKWSGYGALLAFFLCSGRLVEPLEQQLLQDAAITVGIFGYMYLICFGFIGIVLVWKLRFPRAGIVGVLLGLLGICAFPMLEMLAGFFYIASSYHPEWVKKQMENHPEL